MEADLHDVWYGPGDRVPRLDRAHAGGCPRQHHVALLQGEVLGDEADEGRHAEDHVPGVAALPQLPVHLAPEVDVVRVRDARRGDEGAHRQAGVKHLGHGPGRPFLLGFILHRHPLSYWSLSPTRLPLLGYLYLEVPSGHVQGQAVASDILHGGLGSHALAGLVDNHTQLNLVMEVIAAEGDLYVLPSLDVGRCWLHTFVHTIM